MGNSLIWDLYHAAQDKIDNELDALNEKFTNTPIGSAYYEELEEMSNEVRKTFLDIYNNVPRELKIKFTKAYMKYVRRILNEHFSNYKYANTPVWEIPGADLLMHINYKTGKELYNELEQDLFEMYKGRFELYNPNNPNPEYIENNVATNETNYFKPKVRQAIKLSFDKLIRDKSNKQKLIARLQKLGVLNNDGHWVHGLYSHKDSRALCEALVQLGIIQDHPNRLAVFKAFETEFKLPQTSRNFSRAPYDKAVDLYKSELEEYFQ